MTQLSEDCFYLTVNIKLCLRWLQLTCINTESNWNLISIGITAFLKRSADVATGRKGSHQSSNIVSHVMPHLKVDCEAILDAFLTGWWRECQPRSPPTAVHYVSEQHRVQDIYRNNLQPVNTLLLACDASARLQMSQNNNLLWFPSV